MADILVFTLQMFYTIPQLVFPLTLGFTRLLNTSEVSGRDSVQGLYKDSLTYDNLLRFEVKAVITLPNEVDALTRIISYLNGTELHPNDATPLALSVRLS
jgi:hypothetical protein